MKRKPKSRSQAGLTLIELMIAITVLAVGLGGVLLLFVTAIGSNSRSKVDTQAVLVSQTFLETLAAVPANKALTLTVTDCAANARTLTTAPGGANLDSNGNIDWTAAAVTSYSTSYVTCGANGTQTTYDVRWRIGSPYTNTKMITVSSRLKNTSGSGAFFALPVSLRTMTGK